MTLMSPRLLVLGCALLFNAAGCIFVTDPGPGPGPGPDPVIPDPGSGAARPSCSATPFSTVAGGVGAPDPMRSGYIITANSGSYRLTWFGPYKYFQGSVFTSPGALTRFVPGCSDGSCALVSGMDQVVLGSGDSGRIDFVGLPGGTIRKGFDIEVRGGVVWFDLLVDGQRQANRISFVSADTGQLGSAATAPIGLVVLTGPGSGRNKPAAGTTAYRINQSAMPPQMQDNTFGVAATLSGSTRQWLVDWQPSLDGCPHEFRGSMFTDSSFTNVQAGPGTQAGKDVVAQPNNARIDFISVHNMSLMLPSVSFNTGTDPVYFDLSIDGLEAVRKVIFQSGGIPSTNSVMPFALGIN